MQLEPQPQIVIVTKYMLLIAMKYILVVLITFLTYLKEARRHNIIETFKLHAEFHSFIHGTHKLQQRTTFFNKNIQYIKSAASSAVCFLILETLLHVLKRGTYNDRIKCFTVKDKIWSHCKELLTESPFLLYL